jgi:hypothetical protein
LQSWREKERKEKHLKPKTVYDYAAVEATNYKNIKFHHLANIFNLRHYKKQSLGLLLSYTQR